MSLFQAMMVAALLIGGMGVALLGSIKVPLAAKLQITEAKVGGLVSLFGFTLIPVIFTAGFLTDLVGRQSVLIAGCVLFSASVAVLAWARDYLPALFGVVLLSSGWALMINVGNVLTPQAFPGDPGDLAYATNLANVFFGLGAFLTPLTVLWLVKRFRLSGGLAFLAAVSLAPGLLALVVDFAALTPASSADAVPVSLSALLSDPVMWLCGLALFFYGPLEASLAAWTTTYLSEKGCSENGASRTLAAFWLAFMAARLATAFLLPQKLVKEYLFVLAVACILVLLGLVWVRAKKTAMGLVLVSGATFGPIFPTLMAILLGHFDAVLHGRAVGMLFAIGGIGWTVIPILIGAYAQRRGVQRAFLVAVAAAVGLAVVAGLLAMP